MNTADLFAGGRGGSTLSVALITIQFTILLLLPRLLFKSVALFSMWITSCTNK